MAAAEAEQRAAPSALRRDKAASADAEAAAAGAEGRGRGKQRPPRRYEVDFETEIRDKAAELAERLRHDEEELEDSLRRRKEAAADNFSQVVRSALVQVGGLYAVSQACLLVVFVPQRCPINVPCLVPPQYDCQGVNVTFLSPDARAALIDSNGIQECCISSTLFDYTTLAPDGHLCTMTDNLDWENCSTFNQAVLVINLVTLLVTLMGGGTRVFTLKRYMGRLTGKASSGGSSSSARSSGDVGRCARRRRAGKGEVNIHH